MPQDKLAYLIRSRKFWAATVVIVIVLAGPSVGLSEECITNVSLTAAAYILGTALEDGLTNKPEGLHLHNVRPINNPTQSIPSNHPENPVNPVQSQGGPNP